MKCISIINKRKIILPIPISLIVVAKLNDCNEAIMIQKIATGNLINFGIQSIGNNLFIFQFFKPFINFIKDIIDICTYRCEIS